MTVSRVTGLKRKIRNSCVRIIELIFNHKHRRHRFFRQKPFLCPLWSRLVKFYC